MREYNEIKTRIGKYNGKWAVWVPEIKDEEPVMLGFQTRKEARDAVNEYMRLIKNKPLP